MGNKFKDMNRSLTNVKDLGTERALLHIGKKRGTLSDKEISEREQEIHAKNWLVQVDRFSAIHGMLKPLEDLEPLLFKGDKASLTSYNRKMTDALDRDSKAWLRTIDEIQRDYPEKLHVAHLLRVPGESEDDDLPIWDINHGYLLLSVLSNYSTYRQQGLISARYEVNQERVEKRLSHLEENTILSNYKNEDLHSLDSLPVNPRERSTVLRLYLDYLELSAVADLYQPNGAFQMVRGNLAGYITKTETTLQTSLTDFLKGRQHRESA
jgi:hypothetical protein